MLRGGATGVLYQIYPRSFADSNGDGIGDLRGIIAHLDHLEWLGVDGIWLNPTMPSPNDDWGYDVADYLGVHPDLGTLEDLDAADRRGGRARHPRPARPRPQPHERPPPVVPGRADGRDARTATSTCGPTRSPTAGRRTTGCSTFGGSAWTLDEPTGQYYLHNFLPAQPDLNWWNEDVRDEFDDILRFWFDRGVAGFRIDVCHAIVKDRELRDDPPAAPDDHPHVRRRGCGRSTR